MKMDNNLKKMSKREVEYFVKKAAKRVIETGRTVYIMLDDEHNEKPELVISTWGPDKPYNSRIFWGSILPVNGVVYAEHWDDAQDDYWSFEGFCDQLYTYIIENYSRGK